MSNPFTPRVGAVVSADVAVNDHERELRFYSRVLGTGDAPLWQPDLMNNLGIPIVGLGARSEAYASLPLQWMPHIQVADVGAAARRATELGGNVVMQSAGEGAAQWAVALDPNGAAFGLIPVVPAEAVPPLGVDGEEAPPMGRIMWVDLTVPNASATRDFYREVVGWTVQELEMRDGEERYADYVMNGGDGDSAAGVCHARGTNVGLPPVWMIYLPVGDIAESLRIVEEEGGKVIKASKGKDGKYVYAAIQDPVGVALALVPG